MPTTPTYALRYPAATDPADVPTDMSELALDVEGALNGKQASSAKGNANGYASLDAGGLVPVAQLPPSVIGQSLVGTYAARPAANTVPAGTVYFARDTLGQWFSDGTTWTLVAQGVPQIAAAALDSPPWSTPYDGMRMRLLIDSTAGIEWSFVYRSTSASTYKWEFTGGTQQTVYLSGYNALTATSAWVNYGFGIVATRAGEYRCRWGCSAYNTTAVAGAVYGQFAVGTGSIAPAGVGSASQINFTAAVQIQMLSMDMQVTALTGQGIYELILCNSGMTPQGGNRLLQIQPIRIS